MPRELVDIVVEDKGERRPGQKVLWTPGLADDPNADLLVVLAEAVEQGTTTLAEIQTNLNYGFMLKARAKARKAAPRATESVKNQIQAAWATIKPDIYMAVSKDGLLSKGIDTFYRQIMAMNDGKAPARDKVRELMEVALTETA